MQERREIENFKSRWRFPRQAPPSLDAHWFLNGSTAFRCFLDATPGNLKVRTRALSVIQKFCHRRNDNFIF